MGKIEDLELFLNTLDAKYNKKWKEEHRFQYADKPKKEKKEIKSKDSDEE